MSYTNWETAKSVISESQKPDLIRRHRVAGQFYPADPVKLSSYIKELLEKAPVPPRLEDIVGIVSPHAGYIYSGSCAAAGYRALEGSKYDVVVVISPSHQAFFDSVSVFNGGAYETPLGVVYVDLPLAKAMTAIHPKVVLSGSGHSGGRSAEHALEVQLPFLQSVLGSFKLVPIVMGNQELNSATALGEVLSTTLVGKAALIVASSDLSHYYAAATAAKMDHGVAEAIERYDWKILYDRVSSGFSQACGAGPIIACMYACKRLGAKRSTVVQYTHSGMVCGDNEEVVGYLSAVFHK